MALTEAQIKDFNKKEEEAGRGAGTFEVQRN